MAKRRSRPDLSFENHFSLFLLRANTRAGRTWVAEHLPADATRWGNAVVVEPRYVDTIAEGAMADGLLVVT